MGKATHLTAVQLAERIGVQPCTLAMWRVLGRGPKFIKFGTSQQARVRYPLTAVESWEAEQTELQNTSQILNA